MNNDGNYKVNSVNNPSGLLSRGTGTYVKAVPGARCLITTATAIAKPRHDRESVIVFVAVFK